MLQCEWPALAKIQFGGSHFLCWRRFLSTRCKTGQGRDGRTSQPLQSLAATKFQMAINSEGVGRPSPSQEEDFMADDMEKKGQQGGQSGQGQQGGQPGQGQQSGQPGQNPQKKGGQGQNEEDDQNRDRQRRAS